MSTVMSSHSAECHFCLHFMKHTNTNTFTHHPTNRENIVIKRAENIYPVTSEDGSSVGVVASYVHGKVGADVVPANIEVRTHF